MRNIKNKKTRKSWVILLIVVAFVLIILTIYNRIKISNNNHSSNKPHINNVAETKSITYFSKFLNIYIDIPKDYAITDLNDTLKIENNGHKTIILARAGTNFNSLDEYFKSNVTNKKLRKKETKQKIILNNQESYIVNMEYLDYPNLNYRAYYFYQDNAIINLQTNFPELYSDLDQIARSVRYEP